MTASLFTECITAIIARAGRIISYSKLYVDLKDISGSSLDLDATDIVGAGGLDSHAPELS
jgi:hypothetical protein